MSSFSDKLIGNKALFTLEHRILNISLLAGVIMSLQGVISNVILNLSLLKIIVASSGIIIFFSFYLYSRIKIKLKTPAIFTFLFLILIFIPTFWINGAGTKGAFQYYIIWFTFIIIIVLKGKPRLIILSLLISVALSLVVFEYYFPEFIIPYPTEKDRYLDLIINIPIVLVTSSVLIYIYINQYISVNDELVSFNNLLEIQNYEITQHRQQIEIQKNEISLKIEQLEIANENLNCQNIEYEETLTNLQNALNKLEQTQKMLIESEKMAALGNLVAGVAHEMNTPIGIAVQATSGTIDRTKDIAKQLKKENITKKILVDYLNYVFESSNLAYSNLKRTAELIRSFKLVSVDQSTEELRKFRFKSYCSDILISLQSKFKNKDIKVKVECDEKLIIESYPGVFAQIITNLVINSILHGFENQNDGQILIKAEKGKKTLKIIYKDNGKGMSEDILKKIFNPFFTTNKQHGTGLGMHIIYNLVTQKLNGSIICESKINEGVSFIIIVPVNSKKRDNIN